MVGLPIRHDEDDGSFRHIEEERERGSGHEEEQDGTRQERQPHRDRNPETPQFIPSAVSAAASQAREDQHRTATESKDDTALPFSIVTNSGQRSFSSDFAITMKTGGSSSSSHGGSHVYRDTRKDDVSPYVLAKNKMADTPHVTRHISSTRGNTRSSSHKRNNGKTRIHLRLIEDPPQPASSNGKKSLFTSFRRKSRGGSMSSSLTALDTATDHPFHDRGKMTVSWYKGTTSLELQEHVRNSAIRKLGLTGTVKLTDMRIVDDSVDPPEEIVLSPCIPDGSSFILRFRTKDAGGDHTPLGHFHRLPSGPPESPSAAPSPYPTVSELNDMGLNANQLALLGARLKLLQIPQVTESNERSTHYIGNGSPRHLIPPATTDIPNLTLPPRPDPAIVDSANATAVSTMNDESKSSKDSSVSPPPTETKAPDTDTVEDDEGEGEDNSKMSDTLETTEMRSLHPEDPIETRLRQITELLLAERSRKVPKQEKRQVVFVLANYFVLFLSAIAICAEIQARAPGWNTSLKQHFKQVQNCAADQDALFQCVSNGDFAGLIASVLLWISQSAATKRIFLFGFATPQKLWTVVYESLVTAVCWGFSYMFIRRGMNPDTNRNFLQKYWKDAVYGSLAGFNAAFMKQVLKNLIPQEVIEEAWQEKPFKILSWLPSFS